MTSTKLESSVPSGRGLFESGPGSLGCGRFVPSPSPPSIGTPPLAIDLESLPLTLALFVLSSFSLLGADGRDCGNRAEDAMLDDDALLELVLVVVLAVDELLAVVLVE